MSLSSIAEQICQKRYYHKDENGKPIEDWNGLVTRVVNHVCKNEDDDFKKSIFDLIYTTKFLPNSPCLANAGNKISGLLACHVSKSPGDSWEEISRNIKTFGDVARRGGGNGTCFSHIRPAGDPVFGSSHSKACGPIEVMRITSEAMHSITESGFRSMACATGDTYIATEKGYLQIKDIVEKQLIGLKVFTQFGESSIENAWHNGQKKVFEIITERGYKVKLTGDHVVYVINNYNGKNHGKLSKKMNKIGKWEKVSELDKNKDCLVIQIDPKPFGKEYQYINGTKLDEKMAALIAYLKCDGLVADYSKCHRVELVLDSAESYDYFTRNTFGTLDFKTGSKKNGKGGTRIIQKEGKATEFINKNSFGDFYTYDCNIPKEIFASPKSVIAAFVKSAFDAEGGSYPGELRCEIKTGMTSLQFVEGLQILLSMFGIQSSLRRDIVHNNKDGRPRKKMHYLSISNKWHIKKFMEEITFFASKKNEATTRKLDEMDFSGIGRGKVPSYKRIHRIKSISPIGTHDVYDISTTNETFVANNIVVHNCMSTLHVWHPDIEHFITCKQRENALKSYLKDDTFSNYDEFVGKTDYQLNVILDKFISNFNISVVASDKFMQAVKNDDDWNLEFGGRIYKTVKAKEIFDLIANNAWRNGDPGILFEDAVNSGPYQYSGQKIEATNPCVVGSTIVITYDGPKQIKDMVSSKHKILSFDGNKFIWTTAKAFKTKENTKVITIKTDHSSITCTSDHKILTTDGFIAGKDLVIGQGILCNPCLGTSKLELWSTVPVGIELVVLITEENDLVDVYDITTDDRSHNFIANGLIVKNCGEQPLPAGNYGNGKSGGGSCNLGSIDISKFYDKTSNDIDWKSLKSCIECCVQFLDDVIDVNKFPDSEFEQWGKENRPVGLGIMGWADLLLKMQIVYGCDESLILAEKLSKFLEQTSHKKSVLLAKERGPAKCADYKELGNRRNVTLTSIAPTGTISLLASCSSSIEPIFSPTIFRCDNTGKYVIAHDDADKSYFRCAIDKEQNGKREVPWEHHIYMQAAFQKYISSGISKTINLPNSATVEDIKKAYMLSWTHKCKGVTIYRDGCKTTQVLTTESTDKSHSITNVHKRPKEVECEIHKTKAIGFDWHILVGLLNNRPYEVFAVNGRVDLPKNGKIIKKKKKHYSLINNDGNILIENLNDEEELIDSQLAIETRRFSLELRHFIQPKFIIEQIDKSNAPITSFSKAVGRVLSKYMTDDDRKYVTRSAVCPECAKIGEYSDMIYESGCTKCTNCSYSKCG